MSKYIKYLKISYKIEMFLGFFLASYLSFFLSIMATDSPSSTYINAILGAILGFLIVAIPTIIIPIFAIKELNNYKTKTKLIFNIINAIVMFLYFIPLGLWQIYMLYKIKKEQ